MKRWFKIDGLSFAMTENEAFSHASTDFRTDVRIRRGKEDGQIRFGDPTAFAY